MTVDSQITIIDAIRDPKLIGDEISEAQEMCLRVLYGLPLESEQVDLFNELAGRPPGTPYEAQDYKEAAFIIGRRGGKSDKLAANTAIYEGRFRDHSPFLSPGETGVVLCLSQTLRTKIVFNYIQAKLKDKYDLSMGAYTLGRGRFLDANRALVDLMLESDVAAVRTVPNTDPPQVAVRVEKDGHFAEFILINEPVAWINFTEDGDEITLDLPLRDLPSVLQVDGRRLAIDGLPEAPTDLPDKKTINEVRVTKRWRLLEITHMSKSLQEALKDE